MVSATGRGTGARCQGGTKAALIMKKLWAALVGGASAVALILGEAFDVKSDVPADQPCASISPCVTPGLPPPFPPDSPERQVADLQPVTTPVEAGSVTPPLPPFVSNDTFLPMRARKHYDALFDGSSGGASPLSLTAAPIVPVVFSNHDHFLRRPRPSSAALGLLSGGSSNTEGSLRPITLIASSIWGLCTCV
jgi:hypothetical protein